MIDTITTTIIYIHISTTYTRTSTPSTTTIQSNSTVQAENELHRRAHHLQALIQAAVLQEPENLFIERKLSNRVQERLEKRHG